MSASLPYPAASYNFCISLALHVSRLVICSIIAFSLILCSGFKVIHRS